MVAATVPVQRPPDAKLMVVDRLGNIRHQPRSAFTRFFRLGDVVVANDAATLPASLFGLHTRTGLPLEARLAGRSSLAPDNVKQFSAVVFGSGDFRTRTEDRPMPPTLIPGDRLEFGPLQASVVRLLNHPRFLVLQFEGSVREIWEGLARHGRPIQYAHVATPLEVWDTWTPIAGPPVSFEPPSAGFILDWNTLQFLAGQGVRFATITHAAGISSTGDPSLDALLPFDEPYRIPQSTARVLREAAMQGGRVIAVGTTVVRALEHAAGTDGTVRAGEGVATQKIGPATRLRVVDAILSGTHEQGTSHYELLRAFAHDETLRRMNKELDETRYRTHEFGDSVLMERSAHRMWE